MTLFQLSWNYSLPVTWIDHHKKYFSSRLNKNNDFIWTMKIVYQKREWYVPGLGIRLRPLFKNFDRTPSALKKSAVWIRPLEKLRIRPTSANVHRVRFRPPPSLYWNLALRIYYWLRLNVFISVRKWTLFLTFLKISKIFAPDVNDLFLKILTVKQMIQPTLKQAITTHFLSLSPFRNSTWLPCSEIFQLIQKWHKVTNFDTIIYPFHGFITRINFKHSFDSRQKPNNFIRSK